MRALVIAGLAIAAIGCGGDEPEGEPPPGGGGSCELPADYCQGDVTGSWNVSGGCLAEADHSAPDCPSWTCDITGVSASGTLDFAEGGASARVQWAATMTTRCEVPKSCLPDPSCATHAAEHAQRSCTDDGDRCTCTQTDNDSVDVTGTWSIENDLLTITDGVQEAATGQWCAAGDTLDLQVLASRDISLPGNFTASITWLNLSARPK